MDQTRRKDLASKASPGNPLDIYRPMPFHSSGSKNKQEHTSDGITVLSSIKPPTQIIIDPSAALPASSIPRSNKSRSRPNQLPTSVNQPTTPIDQPIITELNRSVDQSAPTTVNQSAPPTVNQSVSSLIHYHISGGKGWQHVAGYRSSTDIQPLRVIRDGDIYGMSFVHSGLEPIPASSIFICKNGTGDGSKIIDERAVTVLAEIVISDNLSDSVNFTILHGEEVKVSDTVIVKWNSQSSLVNRNDCISVYAENLSGADIEFFIKC
jgi:hypothetical protein